MSDRQQPCRFVWMVVSLIVSVLGCFTLMQGFSYHWQIDASWEPLIHTGWLALHMVTYGSAGGIVGNALAYTYLIGP